MLQYTATLLDLPPAVSLKCEVGEFLLLFSFSARHATPVKGRAFHKCRNYLANQICGRFHYYAFTFSVAG